MTMNTRTALAAYQDVKIESGVNGASAHQLIVMLLQGAMDRLASAQRMIEEGDVARRGELISRVISIVDNLRASVDTEKGGEIAENLIALYDYMESRLLMANVQGSAEILDEVRSLLREIETAWTRISPEQREG